MLATALAGYQRLVLTGPASGTNGDGLLSGTWTVDQHAGDTLNIESVGRAGGLHGDKFQSDIADGSWHTRSYQVKGTGLLNTNWFSVADVIAATKHMAAVLPRPAGRPGSRRLQGPTALPG